MSEENGYGQQEYVTPKSDHRVKGIVDFYKSIQAHLAPDYRKRYNIRKTLASIFLTLYLMASAEINQGFTMYVIKLIWLVWGIMGWLFWHYAYFSYQGGFIDSFSRSLIRFGGIFELFWKLIMHNIIIYLWITFISPISGVKTWLKAKKQNKVLYVRKERDEVWN